MTPTLQQKKPRRKRPTPRRSRSVKPPGSRRSASASKHVARRCAATHPTAVHRRRRAHRQGNEAGVPNEPASVPDRPDDRPACGMQQHAGAAGAPCRSTARCPVGCRWHPPRATPGHPRQFRPDAGDQARQHGADQPGRCRCRAALAGQQRPGALQLRRRIPAGGGQGHPRRHAGPELQHRPGRAGHGHRVHPAAGRFGGRIEPAGRACWRRTMRAWSTAMAATTSCRPTRP